MKKKIYIVLLVVAIIMGLNFIFPNSSYALDGGKILSPIMDFLVAICDAVVDILQKVLLGVEDDAFVNIDRTTSFWSKFLGRIAAVLVAAVCIGAAIFFAFPTGGASLALVAVGVKAAVLSIGKVVITYCVVSAITSQMLPGTFYLPFVTISPENILQNKISLFDVNFFENVDTSEYEYDVGSISNDLHNTVSKWYYTLRTIAIIGLMLILLYLGIRVLITSVASEKSKYKKMLGDWFVSLCLLFVIHYIMIFAMQVVNSFTQIGSTLIGKQGVEYIDIVDDKVYDYVKENIDSFEHPVESPTSDTATPIENGEDYSTLYMKDEKKTVRFLVDNFMTQARINMQLLDEDSNATYETISWSIIYILLTIFTVKFVFIYLKRVVYIAFLIVVSPLVVLTYSIDKLHDGQAQGFNTWFKEYLYNLSIQPFHLILYIVFVSSAMSLASNNPIYVLVILGFMTQAEKILRKMFGFEKAATPGVLTGAIGTGLAMSAMQKVFGRKPHNMNEISKGSNNNSSEGGKKRIREQNVDTALDSGTENNKDSSQDFSTDADSKRKLLDEPLDSEDSESEELEESESIDLVEIAQQTENDEEESQSVDEITAEERAVIEKAKEEAEEEQIQDARETVRKNQGNKEKAKFKLGRAVKGAARHYVQTKGKRFADKVNNTSLLRNAAKVAAGGAAALTAGTAGVLLGTAEGSPEKAFRNAGAAGTVAYKGVSDRIEAGKVKGMKESFIEAGYGSDYKKYKEEILARELKHNLENRTILEGELDWNSEEINNFFERTMDEYIEEGVKSLDDMIIGEKLKLDNIVSSTKQAIGVMYIGQQIGTDTRSLTKKKKEEWAETIISQSPTMSKVQAKIRGIQHSYENEIKEIKEMQLEKIEEQKRISKIEARRDADKELSELTRQIKLVKEETFKKLDKYSKYKYK